MTGALADIVPLAVGVAFSPLPILALLLMLLSEHEIANARAFVIGWTGTLAALATAALLTGLSFHTSDPSRAVRAAEIATGVVLLAAAAVLWRRGRGSQERASRWLRAFDGITPLRAGALASALALFNVKDTALSVGAGTVVSDAALTTGQNALALAIFTAIASVTILVPFAVASVSGERAVPTLRSWHAWFERNGTVLVAVVAAVAGVLFVAQGLRGA